MHLSQSVPILKAVWYKKLSHASAAPINVLSPFWISAYSGKSWSIFVYSSRRLQEFATHLTSPTGETSALSLWQIEESVCPTSSLERQSFFKP